MEGRDEAGTREFTYRSCLGHPADVVFRWHERSGALERLTPPWERVEVVGAPGGIAEGARTTLVTRIGPFRKRWVAEHRRNGEPFTFEDRQLEGPFAEWRHVHRVRPGERGSSTMEDRIRYRLPLGRLGDALGARLVRSRLERLFAYRHRILAQDLARHAGAEERDGGVETMKVAVSGSSGLVGSALVPFLTTGGHEVVRLVRRPPEAGEVGWDPAAGKIDRGALEGLDAVVHLAGESIADGRWTAEKMDRVKESRVSGTRLLAESLAALTRKPRVLVCASAIGFYGDRGDEVLVESAPAGSGFLPEVCREWEAACEPARAAGIRVVNLRIGIVLSPAGGALAKILPPFEMGAGGRLGSGRQWMSWISLDDLVGVVHHALVTENLEGPVNAVAPGTVTNADFTNTLGRVLGRPTLVPVPAFAARMAFGKLADELLLASTRVEPRALTETGFRFDHPELEGALRHVLGR